MFEIKEGETITLEKGMMFEDISYFRTVLREYAIERGFTLVRLKNERVRVTAHCGSRRCNWRIHASLFPDGLTFKIKSLGPDHTCVRVERNPEATSTGIVEKFIIILKGNPGMTLEAMHNELTENYGVEASRMQLYREKRKALEAIEGNHAASYKIKSTAVGRIQIPMQQSQNYDLSLQDTTARPLVVWFRPTLYKMENPKLH
ncbi:hypothetical protein ACSBR2_018079 [Camellia fascicularis]